MSEIALPRPGGQAVALPLRLLTDGRLARLAAEGDQRAFTAIYERHHQGIYRYCQSILRDHEDASDAVQATMMKALLAIPAKRPQVPLRAWLFRIAHNEAISVHRRRRRSEPEQLGGSGASRGADELAAERRDLRDLVDDLLTLPERQRTALVMRELSGLDYEEIAVVLVSTPAAAKQSVYDARLALHDRRQGRETSCSRVRGELSEGDRRVLRGRRISAHLRICAGCRDFERSLAQRPAELGAIAPALPGLGIVGILKALLGGGGGGGGGGASGGAVGWAGAAGAVSGSTFNAAAAFTTLAVATGFVASDASTHADPDAMRAPHGRYVVERQLAGSLGHLNTRGTLKDQLQVPVRLGSAPRVGGDEAKSGEGAAPGSVPPLVELPEVADPSPVVDHSPPQPPAAPPLEDRAEVAAPPAGPAETVAAIADVVPPVPDLTLAADVVATTPPAVVPPPHLPAAPVPVPVVPTVTTLPRPGSGEGRGESTVDKPGRGNSSDDKPGRGNSGDDDTGSVKLPSDNPGRGNSGDDNPGRGNSGDDKPGRGNSEEDKPGHGNSGDDNPGRGHSQDDTTGPVIPPSDNPGRGQPQDNPGRGQAGEAPASVPPADPQPEHGRPRKDPVVEDLPLEDPAPVARGNGNSQPRA